MFLKTFDNLLLYYSVRAFKYTRILNINYTRLQSLALVRTENLFRCRPVKALYFFFFFNFSH